MGKGIDGQATLAMFKRVCREITALKPTEIKNLEIELKKKKYKRIEGIYQFEYDDMYEVLLLNPIARRICEKNRYRNWLELVERVYWKEGEDDFY